VTSLEQLTDKVRQALVGMPGLAQSIKLDLKGEGFVHVDGTLVSNDDKAADLTVRVSRADLEALGKGKLNPMTAAITGRLQLSDMSLAMSLMPQMQALFSRFA
jgi:putative sterol carrier protein